MKNLKYYFYKIMVNLTFGKTKERFKFKKEKYKKIDNPENICFINCTGNNNIFDENIIKKYKIHLFIEGNNNEIVIGDGGKINDNLFIEIYGNNNKIYIGQCCKIAKCLFINIGCPHLNFTDDSIVKIGENTDIVETNIMLLESFSNLNIGHSCMFSEQIHIRLSDTHSVLDLEGNLLNYGGNVNVGNGVWLGREVRICKNASIADNSIVGCNSIVTKRFDDPNVVIAGNPAQIVKRGVKWSGLSPQKYKEIVLLKNQ